ncbi:DUF4124 domain-containing protein [Arenimonas oryziterrae]|uniref:DUF4124 domain-containing protein n=1 Tax=Arenimonas oryziterrae DSM 21050 = YC6267 TaxID=1121015 RepID=A0A091AVZ5_9GAMM|nr:DUF4124 domain-containing protein [Arenimonas oryziterrae]KFN43626.1 hypothetical protein N789_10140 [Arenimonas oryziterrae DSM 21050 = YC6267]
MKLFLAILAGVLLAAGLTWWNRHETPRTASDPGAGDETARRDANAPHPLYRWRDANGVLQITDQPPKGRHYEKVTLRADQNVISSSAPAPEPPN